MAPTYQIIGNTIVQLCCICVSDLIGASQGIRCVLSMCCEKAWTVIMNRISHLRLRDYAGWHCDFCARLITSVSDGWVEWLASEDDTGATILNGLRLVHRGSCRYDKHAVFGNRRSVVEGLCLERFMGPDGLILLLSLIAAGELPTVDVIELAKRVQVPGYELVHNLAGRANLPQIVVPSLGHGCYLQSEIAEVLARAMKNHQAA
jgi:hypothetical protein